MNLPTLDFEEARRCIRDSVDLDEAGTAYPSGLDCPQLDRGDPFDEREVATALAFFDYHGPGRILDEVRQNNPNGSQLKHTIERWAREHCFCQYISVGAVLLAARWFSVPLKRIAGTRDAQIGWMPAEPRQMPPAAVEYSHIACSKEAHHVN